MSQPQSHEVNIGVVLGETYEITRRLGAGAMGVVWEARHLRLPGKRVAIKILKNTYENPSVLARFQQEAEVTSRLGHPNIVEVIDFHTLADGIPYIVLEFLEGESLACRLKRGPLPLQGAVEIARQIGSGLHAAHRAQVVHRDLKPDNIFLCPTDSGGALSYRVKVLDFGISKLHNSELVQTADSMLLGTPKYMSPEQAMGKNQAVDKRTDVWALGVIVFEMLTGHPPFEADNITGLLLKIIKEPTPSLKAGEGIPPQVAKAVNGALAKEPEARTPDVASFISALTQQSFHDLDPAGSTGLAAAADRDTAKRRRAIAMAAVVAMIAIGGLAAVQLKCPPSPKLALAAADAGRADVAGPPNIRTGAEGSRSDAAVPGPAGLAAADSGTAASVDAAVSVVPPKIRPRVSEELPSDVVADLEEGEQALREGRPKDALRVARRVLLKKSAPRVFSLLARSYCALKDLGNAKATLYSLSGIERERVIRYCLDRDIDLR